MPAQRRVGLQHDIDVPGALEAVDELVLAQFGEGDIFWVWRGGEGQLHDAGVAGGGHVEATVRGGDVAVSLREGEGGEQREEGGDAEGRDVGAVEVV